MVKRTDGTAKEESKETMGFVAEKSKGDSVPFGTRLSRGKSSVLYLCEGPGSRGWIVQWEVRSIPGSFDAKDGRPHLWMMGVLSIKDGPALRANAAAGP